MKPPVCVICDRDFRPRGGVSGLVAFRKTPADTEWDRMMEEKGMAGHPPYEEWFCRKHYKAAERLKDLTANEALSQLRARFNR